MIIRPMALCSIDFGFQDENYCFCNVCKEKFYQDTGIDLTKVNANSYNQERWNQWKQDQLMQIVELCPKYNL